MIDGGTRLATLALLVALASASCDSGGGGDTSGTTPTSTAGAAQTAVAPAIEDLARKTTMTETARRLFLEARPQIESAAEFNTHCGTVSNQHTLGCLITTQQCRSGDTGCSVTRRIHLLRVDRADLSDVTYVAAAHEKLHVAYQEIPEAERAQVDRQLEAAIAGLDRCKVSVTFGTYGGSAASEKLTEVHSVLGTQFAKLPAAMESHYSKYLSNRQAVLQAHVRTLGRHEDEICVLGGRIDRLRAQLQAMTQQLNGLKAAGDVDAYNRQVPGTTPSWLTTTGSSPNTTGPLAPTISFSAAWGARSAP